VKVLKLAGLTAVWLSTVFLAGCGEVARSGRTPAQVVIVTLEAASGADDTAFSSFLLSDVVTLVEQQVSGETFSSPTIYNDPARVTMRLVLRDPGIPGSLASPTPLNTITIDRYHVKYVRSDGRTTQGVDVPFEFDSSVTFTVPVDGDVTAGFNLVRHSAKQEAPLLALRNGLFISTIAEVTFYGRDQAGNEVSAVGRINVDFGNFADPE
jgi:hypothetical protein